MSADLWSIALCALATLQRRRCSGGDAAAMGYWQPLAAGQHLVQWQCPLTHGTSLVKGALWSVALCAPVALQGRRRCSGDAAAVLRLHSTFVHSGNDSRHLMSSNVHREYTGCAQVVLHQQGATEAATKG
jgi:hypothetical protein